LSEQLTKRNQSIVAWDVFSAVYARCNGDSETWVSMDTIISECLCGRNAARNGMKDLEKLGLLTITPRENIVGRTATNLYRLTVPGFGTRSEVIGIAEVNGNAPTGDRYPHENAPTGDREDAPTGDRYPKVIRSLEDNKNSEAIAGNESQQSDPPEVSAGNAKAVTTVPLGKELKGPDIEKSIIYEEINVKYDLGDGFYFDYANETELHYKFDLWKLLTGAYKPGELRKKALEHDLPVGECYAAFLQHLVVKQLNSRSKSKHFWDKWLNPHFSEMKKPGRMEHTTNNAKDRFEEDVDALIEEVLGYCNKYWKQCSEATNHLEAPVLREFIVRKILSPSELTFVVEIVRRFDKGGKHIRDWVKYKHQGTFRPDMFWDDFSNLVAHSVQYCTGPYPHEEALNWMLEYLDRKKDLKIVKSYYDRDVFRSARTKLDKNLARQSG
jgi:hypothetical protein